VLGRSATQTGAASANERRVALSEQGWSIEYLGYESAAPDALPILMRARRDEVDLRLKVDSWSEVR
jgi:outer membrane biogenesis lipoprotein LolB